MTKANLLGPWVRRFLLEYLVSERNLARNTHCSYRDTLRLLLPFVAQKVQREVDRILGNRRISGNGAAVSSPFKGIP